MAGRGAPTCMLTEDRTRRWYGPRRMLKIPCMTVLTATLTCPHCGHKKTETMPTNALRASTSARHVTRFFGPNLATVASSALMGRADAHHGRVGARDYGAGPGQSTCLNAPLTTRPQTLTPS